MVQCIGSFDLIKEIILSSTKLFEDIIIITIIVIIHLKCHKTK